MSARKCGSALSRFVFVCVWRGLCGHGIFKASQPGDTYNQTEANMLASIASVTYCHNLQIVRDWSCTACKDSNIALVPGKIEVLDGGYTGDTRVLIGKLAHQPGCVMAFRGSSNLDNWIHDLKAGLVTYELRDASCPGCMVHLGFLTLWNAMSAQVLQTLQDVGCSPGDKQAQIFVTGHSLGAALTVLAMFGLSEAGFTIARNYNFESPRVGNKAFTQAFANRFGANSPVIRVTHYMDPVVHMPPELNTGYGYWHIQQEVWINFDNVAIECPKAEDGSCSDQFWDLPGMLAFHTVNHCETPLLPNKDFCHPVGCSVSSPTQATEQVIVV